MRLRVPHLTLFFLATTLASANVARPQQPLSDTIVVRVRSNSVEKFSYVAAFLLDTLPGSRDTIAKALTSTGDSLVLPLSPRPKVRLVLRAIGYAPRDTIIVPERGANEVLVSMKVLDLDLSGVCAGPALPGIRLVVDSAISSGSVVAVFSARRASYIDSRTITLPSASNVELGSGLAGTVDVEVRAPGYQVWRRQVQVPWGGCAPDTQTLRVRLVPERDQANLMIGTKLAL